MNEILRADEPQTPDGTLDDLNAIDQNDEFLNACVADFPGELNRQQS